MCFSAEASFGAGAVLGIIGVVAIAKTNTKSQRLFAGIPIFFAIQQLTEGMLWLTVKDTRLAEWETVFTYTFLVFAMMVWPLLIPLTIRLLETNARRKKIINVLLGIGSLVFAGVGYVLVTYPVEVVATHHHLHYNFGLSMATKNILWIFSLLYFIATIVTPFISSIKRMKWLGIIFLVSYTFAVIFFDGFVVSVWCFFGAILSIIILWILPGIKKTQL